MVQGKGKISVGLDVGSASVKAAVTHTYQGEARLIGLAQYPVRRGGAEAVEEAIRAVIEQVGKASDCIIEAVSTPLPLLEHQPWCTEGGTRVARRNKVSARDLRAAREHAGALLPVEGLFILHQVPVLYRIDHCQETLDPLGSEAARLDLESCIVPYSAPKFLALERTIGQAKLKVEDAVLSGLAHAEALLDDKLRMQNSLVLDFGHRGVRAFLFVRGRLVHAEAFEGGGEALTQSLQERHCPQRPWAEVENVKCMRLGEDALGEPLEDLDEAQDDYGVEGFVEDEILLPALGVEPACRLSRRRMAAQLQEQSRQEVQRIAERLRPHLRARGRLAKVLLTGAGAKLVGLRGCVAQIFQVEAAIGRPQGLVVSEEFEKYAADPAFAAAIGVALSTGRQRAKVWHTERPRAAPKMGRRARFATLFSVMGLLGEDGSV